MKNCVGGDGSDTTTAVLAWLNQNNHIQLCSLYLIGEPEHPRSIWITDYESPLLWSILGKPFQPAVIKRSSVKSKIGLEVEDMTITWSPRVVPFTQSVF